MDKEDSKSDDGSDGGASEGELEKQKFVKDELAEAKKWDATGVSVDQKTFQGRRAVRGFTIAMGKSDKVSSDTCGRSSKRSVSLPYMRVRRGDFAVSEETGRILEERRLALAADVRGGSVNLECAVIPEEELRRCCEEHFTAFVTGKTAELQAAGDERDLLWCTAMREWPGKHMPAIICTKGSKGSMDIAPNQDNFSLGVMQNGYSMACCMDGHGPLGHLVSVRAVLTVPYYLLQSEKYPDDMTQALVEAFERTQKELVMLSLEEGWDVQASGSTAVVAVWKDDTVWTANVGDSRCVIGYEDTRKIHSETADHKPDSPEEQARIELHGGEVRTQVYPDGWESHRIFVKGEDFPGLCMTRTFGDESVKAHGVIATPDVVETKVNLADNPFIVLASDGIWEFLDSERVVKALAKKIPSDGAQRTVHKLQREARKRWKEEEGEYCDDITALLVRLRSE